MNEENFNFQMASVVAEPVHEIPHWLKTLPVAPEFHPTVAEFEDPISYILKIEKQASRYGICKIVPPVSLPSKKTTITNLNRSLASRNPNFRPTFTTRYQQIGFDPRKGRPVQKPVWQSGEYYTLQGFETHAKLFEKNYLKKCGKKSYSALEIETLFWRACVDKPFTVEYANDMPGSAFVSVNNKLKCLTGDGVTVGDTEWNMRGVARSKGSLLRFMKEEIPGVTSPMVYIAMLFSWFAWHVEDHDLHSLNYMHMGAPKTWYGVPKDAAFAFQDVVRVQGYGGDFNPLVTFATLGEKTTVMSPEVLIGAGIPCCRLVQNVGDFVVTFPGAYHSGFSHGFNFAEASNIATPEWLRFAKEAAIRRASINGAPMVSHYQLLYALALALCSRVPMSISNEPRSSRLKDKKRGEGEGMVKDFFLQSMMQNNELLHILSCNGSPCVLLPRHTSEIVLYSNGGIGTQKVKHRMLLGFCSNSEATKSSRNLVSDEKTLENNVQPKHLRSSNAANEISNSLFMGDRITSVSVKQCEPGNVDLSRSVIVDTDINRNSTTHPTGLLEHARFPCVQCGILSFACAAVIQPREAAAQYLMSADSSFFNEWTPGFGVLKNESTIATESGSTFELNCTSSVMENACQDGLYDVPVKSGDYQIQVFDKEADGVSHAEAQEGITSLDLLASAYGNSSDSDEEQDEPEMAINDDNIVSQSLSGDADDYLSKSNSEDDSRLHLLDPDCQDGACGSISQFPFCQSEASVRSTQCTSYSRRNRKRTSCDVQSKIQQISDCGLQSDAETLVPMKCRRLEDSCRDTEVLSGRIITGSSELNEMLCTNHIESAPVDSVLPSTSFCPRSKFSEVPLHGEITKYSNIDLSTPKTSMALMQISNEESYRKHIFCLEHAVEVEKQLRPIGGANILLLCHPEYPKAETAAKSLAQDLVIDHLWKDILFKEATKEDQETISVALHDEEADPSHGDWAVKLGINLYYSVQLSKSPLYTKQMPHNSIIYKAFGCSSTNSPLKTEVSGRQKKVVVAGNWCGKVWTSNQVHPYLNQRENKEDDSMSCHIQGMPSLKSCPKFERKMEIDQPVISEKRSFRRVTTTITRKLGKKKKRKSGKLATKKEETPELESPTQSADDSSESDSSLLSNTRFIRNGKTEGRVKNFKQYDLNSTIKIEGRPTVAGKRGPKKKTKPGNEAAEFERSPQLESRSQTAEASSDSGFDSDSSPLSNGRFLKEGRTNSERSLLPCSETEGGPSTRLRRRPSKPVEEKMNPVAQKLPKMRRMNKAAPPNGNDTKDEEGEHQCDMDGCTMSFTSKQELALHKKNICSFKGCGKKFFSHKYLVQHRRVHFDDRPLKCPWKGCSMTFKWAWARTEHIRVHTGDRPYKCGEKGCGQTFRFVSDFSRHKRKTGHVGKGKK